MNNDNLQNYLLIYSDCIVVNGIKNSIIHDLTRSDIHKIPAEYAGVIKAFSIQTLGEIKSSTSPNDWEQIENFIAYILENKMGTFVNDLTLFPKLDLTWDSPTEVIRAIVDYKTGFSDYSIESVFEQLNKLGCQDIEVRTYSTFDNVFFEKLILLAEKHFIASLEVVFKDDQQTSDEVLKSYILNHHVISKITFTNSTTDNLVELNRGYVSIAFIIRSKAAIESHKSCGQISATNMYIPNLDTFTENQTFNSCLNRKIGIDVNGRIKNCPSMKKDYGHINEVGLQAAVNQPGFKQLWSITKNEIDVCKSCEFRQMCTDCRAYLKDNEDIYSQPLKCGYNPKTGTWTNWMRDELNKKGISYYEL